MTPDGVQGASTARPCDNRPALIGVNPSTSLAGSMTSKTACDAPLPMPDGSGSCTRMPSKASSAFKRRTVSRTSASVAVSGRRNKSARQPMSEAAFSLFLT